MSFDPNTINLVKPTDKALIGTLIDGDAFLVFRGDSTNFTTYRFNYQSLVALIQTFIPDITVIDTLSSNSSANALSAKQGTVLKGLVDDLITAVGNKLDASSFNEHYRGTYTTLGNLQTAIATGDAGNYALVDSGIGNDAVYYIWDAEDGWVSGGTTTASTTDTVTEGSTNLYFTDARVRNTVLTDLSLATNAAISAADSVLGALGKLQKQITDTLTNQRYTFNEQSTTTCTIASADITSNGRVIIICANASAISGSLNTPSSYGATVGDSFNIRQGGLGAITLTATGGAVLTGTATTTAQHETKTLIAQAANTWLVVGG